MTKQQGRQIPARFRSDDATDPDSYKMDCLVYGNLLQLDAPTGFVLQLTIFSTWGDAYYVGLTGVELYAPDGSKVPVTETSEFYFYSCFVEVLQKLPYFVRRELRHFISCHGV